MRIVRSSFTRLALSAAAFAIAAPALAQEATDGESEGDSIIVTAQREARTEVTRGGSVGVLGDKPAEDVPFSIKSYNAALILNQQPQTIGQVLENDPSIRTTYGYGNAAELFVIRGFVLAGDDVGLDGLYGIAPRQLIAPELYDSVQVLNGASAFLNGAAPGGSGLGGSVNLVPKRAGGRDLNRVTANYTSTSHFGGSFDVARRFGDFGVRVNGVGRSGDVSVDDEFRSAYTLGAAFDYDGGPLRLSLDLAYQKVRVEGLRHKVKLGVGVVPRVPDAEHNFAQDWTWTEMEDVFGIAKLEYDLSDNALFYASFGARDGSEEGNYGGITINNAVTGAATYDAAYIPRTDNNEAAQAGIRVKLAHAGITHEVNFGGSMLWQVNRNAYEFYVPSSTPDTNLYTDVTLAEPTAIWFAGGNLDEPFAINRTKLGSAFASDTIGFLDDRVLVTAGIRMQAMNLRGYSYFGGAQTSEYDESAITPVFGLVVKPVEGISLFANRIQGLQQGPTAPIDAALINPGEVFGPNETTQYEAGIKLGFGRFNASLAAYQTDQPSAYAITDPEGSGKLRYGIYGKQRNRGIEFSVDGQPVDGLRLIAGASLTDAKFRETSGGLNEGNKAPGVPDYTANANVEWDVFDAVTLTGRVVHTGPQQVDAGNTLELDSWTRFDLGIRYVAPVGNMPLTLRAGVDNVLNERYWASAFDSFLPQLLQGAPRTFKLSASIDL